MSKRWEEKLGFGKKDQTLEVDDGRKYGLAFQVAQKRFRDRVGSGSGLKDWARALSFAQLGPVLKTSTSLLETKLDLINLK